MGGRLSLVDCLRLGSGLGVPGAEGDGLWGSMGVGAPVSRSGLPGLCWNRTTVGGLCVSDWGNRQILP